MGLCRPIDANSFYRSTQELDKYGSSPQINNAGLASKLHSLPTIVTSSRSSSLIIVSLEKKKPGVVPRNKCNVIGQSEDCKLATIGSGLAGDAAFLNKLLRKDVMHTWERYDAIPDCTRVAHTASRVMLAFMGYGDEILDGSRDVLLEDNGDRISIGRPLGVNMIIAKLYSSGDVEMRLVEPSGVVSDELVGRVLGRGSKKGTELLKQRWRESCDDAEIEDISVAIVKEITISEYLVGDHGGEEDYNIVIETLNCKDGLQVKRIPFASA
jgi:20S proteasome alpha/beta subunit